MTNKKAIKIINAVKFILDDEQYSDEVEEALNMAIKALESVTINADPNEIKVTNCNDNDLISRQWLMECVEEGWIKFETEIDENRFIHLVRDIAPSAQPETHDKRTETHACDLISRQAAIDEANAWLLDCFNVQKQNRSCGLIRRLEDLPSAQPESPERTAKTAQNVSDSDLISRKAAIDALRMDVDIIPFAKAKEYARAAIETIYNRLEELPPAQPEPQTARVFQEIIVEYPSISTYPEYEGKPYFSIKYTEDGKGFIGYGTYKPEVLSEYLIKYFMPSAQPERAEGEWVQIQRCARDAQPDLECPFCKHRIGWFDMGRYCAGCGAKLKGGAG